MKKASLPLILGSALILLSFLYFAFLQVRLYLGEEKREEILFGIEKILPDTPLGLSPEKGAMPAFELDGKDYIALLSVPAFSVKAPVAAAWAEKDLYASPCRYMGSAYEKNLVIGGMDVKEQFSFCKKIDLGALIELTDMTGEKFSYSVARVDRVDRADLSFLSESAFPLTLFCRDKGTGQYLAVRCEIALQ